MMPLAHPLIRALRRCAAQKDLEAPQALRNPEEE
jgi:hypothetical protein